MRTQARIAQWFLTLGMRLLLYGSKFSVYEAAKLFDIKSLARHSKRIVTDHDFDSPDAVRNQVAVMMNACLSRDYQSQYYPRLRTKNKTWLQMLGIKPMKPPLPGAIGIWLLSKKYRFDMIRTFTTDIFRSVKQARRTGTLKETISYNKVDYLLSRGIANQRGIDRERNTTSLENIKNEPSTQKNSATETVDLNLFIESARLSPQESLIVQAWQSGDLPLPGKQRPHSTVKNFALETGLSYQAIRTIENRARKKLMEVYRK